MNNTAMVIDNETTELEKRALDLTDVVTRVTVVDAPTRTVAIGMLKDLVDEKKRIVAHFEPHKKRAHAAWKGICDDEAQHIRPIENLERMLRSKVNTFDTAEQARIREEQRKLEIEAEERARKEREKLVKQAEKAGAKGQAEKAEALREQAEQTIAAPVFAVPAVPKTEKLENGATASVRKDIEVIIPETTEAIRAICRAVADGQLPATCVKINPTAIKSWGKLQGIKNAVVFGVTFRETSSIAIR